MHVFSDTTNGGLSFHCSMIYFVLHTLHYTLLILHEQRRFEYHYTKIMTMLSFYLQKRYIPFLPVNFMQQKYIGLGKEVETYPCITP